MNNPENTKITFITPEDVRFIENELSQTPRPVLLQVLAEKLAFQKTAGQRNKEVKKFDPYSRYETGDYIFKEYEETLTVGSKNVERFTGAVILKVVGKTYYKNFNCEMLEVDYAGGGIFRKYVDYMKKTKTEVLLPSNLEGRNQAAEIMDKGSDPRLSELPMTERDLKTLERNLRASLVKSPALFSWNDFWQLIKNQVELPDDKIKGMAAAFEKTRTSAATEDLVKNFLGLEPSSDLFEIHCLSLNSVLDKKYKKEFIPLSMAGWGKWHLKKILNGLVDGLPLAAPSAKLPELEENEKPAMSVVSDFPIKIYLTWREILSGGIKVPRSLNKVLSRAREYTFTDPEEGKNYTLFYYPSTSTFLGLQDYYAHNNIPQGTSLTLERKGPEHFHFWIKKSKKKLSALKLGYDPKEDRFSDSGEEAFTFAEPNKIIYIDHEVLAGLLPLYNQRNDFDLKDLLVLVFKNAARSATVKALHFLRAYHLVDILKQTTQEDVEFTLLNASEFSKSEKKKGIFFYQEPYEMKEEFQAESPVEEPAILPETPRSRAEGEVYLPPGTVGFEDEEEEDFFPDGPPEIIDLTPSAKAEAPAATTEEETLPSIPAALKEVPTTAPTHKEKPHKKKKLKPEGEKAPRSKKSERRAIEEKIVEEESELEALAAIKQKEEGLEEQRARSAKEKKEEPKSVTAEEPKFGIFGDLLKSALTQKKKEDLRSEDEKEKQGKKKKGASAAKKA